MKIAADTLRVSRQWAGASPHFPRLMQAVDRAEGGGARLIKAVQCSYPAVVTRDQALQYACRTWTHFMADFIADHCLEAFLEYGSARWAPPAAANDPRGLNANFLPNVRASLIGPDR